jgi:hypothetical protein
VVARDNDDARLGKDVLQLVDQIGFLRTIHANSNISIEAGLDRGSTKPGAIARVEHMCPWGDGSAARGNPNARRKTHRTRCPLEFLFPV